ncbi:MAG: hypothetical protein RMJ60_02815 [Anaerolineales bacterium]|nr:hypothetical protein [Anaerolineales bacterium]
MSYSIFLRILLPCFLLVLLGASACSILPARQTSTPTIHTLEVTQLMIREATIEVTRIVEVLVTVTPSPTWVFSPTPSLTPSITPTPELPRAILPEYTDCLYGPGDFYLYKTSYPAGSQVEVIGRSQDYQWLAIQEIRGWNPCWIPADRARLEGIGVNDLPFVYTSLPLVRYDYRYPVARAMRKGNIVTLSWEAVWMSQYELRGYLIEAWVCRNGEIVFMPIGITPTYEQNTGKFSVEIVDEAGCAQASRVRIATVSKRGYTVSPDIPWPPASP